MIGDLIREARVRAGLTQTQLAEMSGTSQATLSAYERGRKGPSAATLARVLGAAGARLAAVPARRPVRIPSRGDLEHRGRILAQTLDLAERLPARHSPDLRYPVLRELVR
jgi:transcriptional regulator with XRE-family HTH domain